uniref:Putative secreted protein n=1 Tax=Panstrongylus lignarius TaxID=156445 RepID=A0A224Y3M7_9HEMI
MPVPFNLFLFLNISDVTLLLSQTILIIEFPLALPTLYAASICFSMSVLSTSLQNLEITSFSVPLPTSSPLKIKLFRLT